MQPSEIEDSSRQGLWKEESSSDYKDMQAGKQKQSLSLSGKDEKNEDHGIQSH